MMIALKIRAWHIPTGRMLYFDRLWICTEYDSIAFELAESSRQEEYSLWAGHSHLPSNNVADYIFMLCTDLPDKNGKEIFAGDRYRQEWKGETVVGEIIYGDMARYWIKVFDGYLIGEIKITGEVIGNIYENPELI